MRYRTDPFQVRLTLDVDRASAALAIAGQLGFGFEQARATYDRARRTRDAYNLAASKLSERARAYGIRHGWPAPRLLEAKAKLSRDRFEKALADDAPLPPEAPPLDTGAPQTVTIDETTIANFQKLLEAIGNAARDGKFDRAMGATLATAARGLAVARREDVAEVSPLVDAVRSAIAARDPDAVRAGIEAIAEHFDMEIPTPPPAVSRVRTREPSMRWIALGPSTQIIR